MKAIVAGGLPETATRLFGSRLPPGMRDADGEGQAISFATAAESELWRICGLRRQEELSARFAESHADFLRDLILDAEDSSAGSRSDQRVRESFIARALWSAWTNFRDKALREMRGGGELSEI